MTQQPDSGIAALRAAESAIERLAGNLTLALRQAPVRDATETFAEACSALAAIRSAVELRATPTPSAPDVAEVRPGWIPAPVDQPTDSPWVFGRQGIG